MPSASYSAHLRGDLLDGPEQAGVDRAGDLLVDRARAQAGTTPRCTRGSTGRAISRRRRDRRRPRCTSSARPSPWPASSARSSCSGESVDGSSRLQPNRAARASAFSANPPTQIGAPLAANTSSAASIRAPALLHRQPVARVLLGPVAQPDAVLEAPAGQLDEPLHLRERHHRVIQRQQVDAGADPQRRRRPQRRGGGDQRRRAPAVVREVMLGHPQRVEPERLDERARRRGNPRRPAASRPRTSAWTTGRRRCPLTFPSRSPTVPSTALYGRATSTSVPWVLSGITQVQRCQGIEGSLFSSGTWRGPPRRARGWPRPGRRW